MTDEENMGKHNAPETPETTLTEKQDTPPTDAPVVEQSQPVDTPLENLAHPVEEDPEQHLGDEINDPWDDETQTDWPGGVVDLPEVKS